MLKIRTNEVIPSFDYDRIDSHYDIFCLETSKKCFDRGAKIIDAPLMNKNVKAVLFEKGRKFYVLLNHNTGNLPILKSVLSNSEYGTSISISQKSSSSLSKTQLLQLLINGLAAKNNPVLKFNNLTGHLYVFMPEWVKKGKDNTIWSIPTLEIKVTEECILKLNVRTFSSVKLKNKIKFTTKRFEEYPRYILSSDNSLRRKVSDDRDTTIPEFILRQVENTKSEITFLNISKADSYEATKVGVLTHIVEKFNKQYDGLTRIEFRSIFEFTTIDTKNTAKENIFAVKCFLSNHDIKIIDCVKIQQSKLFCKNIADLIYEKYDCKTKIGSRLSKNSLNIRLIHNKDYYEKTQNDPHQDNISEYAVQHITFEDFAHNSRFAISTVIHELIIKEDIRNGIISLFDWEELGFSNDISFGISKKSECPRYFFMTIKPNGSFFFSEQKMDLFEMNEYSTCAEIFDNDKLIEGIIKYCDEDILAIRNSGLSTLPEFEELKSELNSGNTALRNKDSRDEYLTSVTEIRKYHLDNKDYYSVGICGSGMKPSIQNSAIIRTVEQKKTGNADFSRLLPLMNVSFVRNGQLTVIPFPFKYLREYITMIEKKEGAE